MLNGFTVTQVRERDVLVDVVLRATGDERARLSALADVNLRTASGRSVPLAQVAKIRYELEDGLIVRRNRLPTVTVRADIRGDRQGPVVSQEIEAQLKALRARCASGAHADECGVLTGLAEAAPDMPDTARRAARHLAEVHGAGRN